MHKIALADVDHSNDTGMRRLASTVSSARVTLAKGTDRRQVRSELTDMGSAVESRKRVRRIQYTEKDAKVGSPAGIAADRKIGGNNTISVCETQKAQQ